MQNEIDTKSIKLNEEYVDFEGNKYKAVELVKSCCTFDYWHLLQLDTGSIYPYNSFGLRLNHKLKYDSSSVFNIKFSEV